MSEAEVVKDIAAVLAKVRQGVEVVIEQERRANPRPFQNPFTFFFRQLRP